jgi:hypothetical protein
MHPIERLRYVARASGVPQRVIVQETAAALASFGSDPQGLVTACRRIVSRQPASGPLLWFAARVLTAGDPQHEIWEAAGDLQADPTGRELIHAIPQDAVVTVLGWPDEIADVLPRRGDVRVFVVDTLSEGSGFVHRLLREDVDATDVPLAGLGAAAAASSLVLLEASAIGPREFLAVAGSRAAAAVARHAGIPVWLVGGVGRLRPPACGTVCAAASRPSTSPGTRRTRWSRSTSSTASSDPAAPRPSPTRSSARIAP